jgi:branched-chain amino acid transport system permease protein
MFFGIAGYGIGIASARLGATGGSLALGAALATSALLALAIGLVSLRVKTIFFAMIMLAVGSCVMILASQLSWLTGGEDGLNHRLPALLMPGTRLVERPILGVDVNGHLVSYYLVFGAALALLLVLLRVVNSPFGRSLLWIRENEFRSESLCNRTVSYRTVASCLGALMATAAGILHAIWLRYTGPDTTLSFSIMIDILLMVVISGMGTMYGTVVGATLFVVAQNYLQYLMKLASGATQGVPLLPSLLHPDRWLFWLGVLFILCVYYFPFGIVGNLRRHAERVSPRDA